MHVGLGCQCGANDWLPCLLLAAVSSIITNNNTTSARIYRCCSPPVRNVDFPGTSIFLFTNACSAPLTRIAP